jgi:hypothetical protein
LIKKISHYFEATVLPRIFFCPLSFTEETQFFSCGSAACSTQYGGLAPQQHSFGANAAMSEGLAISRSKDDPSI